MTDSSTAFPIVTRVAPWASLHPNPWNPNVMDERTYAAAAESIQTFGFIDPVTVRPHPEIEGHFQIIDGYHRWKVVGDLRGQDTEVPLIVLDVDDTGARKLTIILNETRGEADPVLLGTLLAQLNDSLDIEALRIGLRYDDAELAHLMSLADVDWDKFEPAQEKETPPAADGEWQTITARIPAEVWVVWQSALDKIKDETDLHADPAIEAGQALEILAAAYIAG